MRHYEQHVIESNNDILQALDVGLLEELPTECAECGEYLTVPYTVTLGEDDISVSRCGDCLRILR